MVIRLDKQSHSVLFDMNKGVVCSERNRQNWIKTNLRAKMKYFKVSMKVQSMKNFISMNRTSPRQPKKTILKIEPRPLEGKRLKLTFWWLSPMRNKPKRTTRTTQTKPVKIAGGSILWAGASVIIMLGVVYRSSLAMGCSRECLKVTLQLAMNFLTWVANLSSLMMIYSL